MARTSGVMITWNDMDDMVTLESFTYNLDAPASPANMNKCATKLEIENYLVSYVSGSYTSNQLVPYQKIYRGLSVDPLTLTWTEFGSLKTVDISTPNSWTAAETASWITLSATSGTGDTTINVTATTNLDIARNTTIEITDTLTSEIVNVSISQDEATGIDTDPIDLAVGAADSGGACSIIKGEYETVYIPSGSVFATTTDVYSNALGTINAGSGWYSDGDVAREWDGSAFVGSNVNC